MVMSRNFYEQIKLNGLEWKQMIIKVHEQEQMIFILHEQEQRIYLQYMNEKKILQFRYTNFQDLTLNY